nr:RteC domain-containing protein [uncultured Draconibacterium sp.]
MLVFLEHLIQYVEIEIKCTKLKQNKKGYNATNTLNDYKGAPISWTASKRDLLELIFALNLTMCFNNGKTTQKELVGFFSHIFNISLPGYHATIKRMADRKGDVIQLESRSFFINEMLRKFNSKLDILDEN